MIAITSFSETIVAVASPEGCESWCWLDLGVFCGSFWWMLVISA